MASTMKRVFSVKKKEDPKSPTIKRSKEEKEREEREKKEIKEKEKEIKGKEKEEKKREKEEKKEASKPRVTFQESERDMTPSPVTRERSKTAPNKTEAFSPPSASSTKLIMSPSVGEILPPMPDFIELERMFENLLVLFILLNPLFLLLT